MNSSPKKKASEIIAEQEAEEKRLKEIRASLIGYLKDFTEANMPKIEFMYAESLPGKLKDQYQFMNDIRLAKVVIAIVPDEHWHKGASQVSESDGERQFIKIRTGYLEDAEQLNQTGWAVHELAHCQVYLNNPRDYYENSGTLEFDDIGDKIPYPNNRVEAKTFAKQFAYLKSQGLSRAEIIAMLQEAYTDENDFVFFNRLLDKLEVEIHSRQL
jgi:hypothetical protein